MNANFKTDGNVSCFELDELKNRGGKAHVTNYVCMGADPGPEMSAILYARTDASISVGEQLRNLRSYCERYGVEIVDVYVDDERTANSELWTMVGGSIIANFRTRSDHRFAINLVLVDRAVHIDDEVARRISKSLGGNAIRLEFIDGNQVWMVKKEKMVIPDSPPKTVYELVEEQAAQTVKYNGKTAVICCCLPFSLWNIPIEVQKASIVDFCEENEVRVLEVIEEHETARDWDGVRPILAQAIGAVVCTGADMLLVLTEPLLVHSNKELTYIQRGLEYTASLRHEILSDLSYESMAGEILTFSTIAHAEAIDRWIREKAPKYGWTKGGDVND